MGQGEEGGITNYTVFNKVVCFQIPRTFRPEASLETKKSGAMGSF